MSQSTAPMPSPERRTVYNKERPPMRAKIFAMIELAVLIAGAVAIFSVLSSCTGPISRSAEKNHDAGPDERSSQQSLVWDDERVSALAACLRRQFDTDVAGDSSLTHILSEFYEKRGDAPVWVGPRGLNHRGEGLLRLLRDAHEDGLNPDLYQLEAHASTAAGIYSGDPKLDDLCLLDLDLTRTLLDYMVDLSAGVVDPKEHEIPWRVKRKRVDMSELLTGLDDFTSDELVAHVRSLAPPHRQYEVLRRELATLRSMDEWETIPDVGVVEAGDSVDVAWRDTLERRLVAEGFLHRTSPRASRASVADTALAKAVFDERLSDAVKRYQEVRGIETDGVIGPQTYHELGIPLVDRIRTVELNMERWRWIPVDLHDRRIEVNTAAFRLQAYDGSEPAFSCNVIVGKEGWKTPLFSDEMTSVVFHPRWNVPRSIVTDEIIPKAERDSTWLARQGFEVSGYGSEDWIPASEFDWSSVDATEFRYRQTPGPRNPLGVVKFLFPNQFAVYLHDTSSRHLFERTDRAFSHGCIRVEKPAELAAYVLEPQMAGASDGVRRIIESEERNVINLEKPIPVHILYWTAWVDDGGRLEFHQDLYGVDDALDRAMRGERDLASRES